MGFIDPFERPYTLLDVLSTAKGEGLQLHPEPEERTRDTAIEGSIVVRLGEGNASRYFALLPRSYVYLEGFVPQAELASFIEHEEELVSGDTHFAYSRTWVAGYTNG